MEACAAQDVRGPRQQSRNQAIGETELAAERDGRALLRQQRIGSAVNHPSIESIGTNDTTEPVARFDEQNVDTPPPQFVGCRQTGDTSADNDYFAIVHGSIFLVLRSSSISVFRLCSRFGFEVRGGGTEREAEHRTQPRN
jgi:hypothetical protein